jgi:hypothetical protein
MALQLAEQSGQALPADAPPLDRQGRPVLMLDQDATIVVCRRSASKTRVDEQGTPPPPRPRTGRRRSRVEWVALDLDHPTRAGVAEAGEALRDDPVYACLARGEQRVGAFGPEPVGRREGAVEVSAPPLAVPQDPTGEIPGGGAPVRDTSRGLLRDAHGDDDGAVERDDVIRAWGGPAG